MRETFNIEQNEVENMPKALITGITGQDGSYLAEFLLTQGCKSLAWYAVTSTVNFHRIAEIQDQIELVPGDLGDQISLIHILEQHRPPKSIIWQHNRLMQTSWTHRFLPSDVTEKRDSLVGCHSHC